MIELEISRMSEAQLEQLETRLDQERDCVSSEQSMQAAQWQSAELRMQHITAST